MIRSIIIHTPEKPEYYSGYTDWQRANASQIYQNLFTP